MYMVELSEDKMEGLCEYVEKSLKYMGKVMHCMEELKDSNYRYNRKDRDEWDDEEMMERKRRKHDRY